MTLLEVLAAVAVIAVIAAMLAPLAERSRRHARIGEDLANLRRIGALTASYAADNSDLYWAFSWKAGTSPSTYPDLMTAGSTLEAQGNQAVDILRRRGNRPDMPKILPWLPHVTYTHLVLQDYAAMALPERMFISAADRLRLLWAGDPSGFDRGAFLPMQPAPEPIAKRWPYSSSYQVPSVFWDLSPERLRIEQAGTHSTYFAFSNGILRGAPVSDVAFPSQKVFVHDQASRHFNNQGIFFSHPSARVAMLFSDGQAGLRATNDANKGWSPNNPQELSSTVMSYTPAPERAEPPAVDPSGRDVTDGYYRWTRGTFTKSGIVGRDFGGPEPAP